MKVHRTQNKQRDFGKKKKKKDGALMLLDFKTVEAKV